MSITVRESRLALANLIKGVALIILLSILRAKAGSLPAATEKIGDLMLSDWVVIGCSLLILIVALAIFRPLKVVVAFYLAQMLEADKTPDRQPLFTRLIAVTDELILLLYIITLYRYAVGVIPSINRALGLLPNNTDVRISVDYAVLLAIGIAVILLARDVLGLIDVAVKGSEKSATQAVMAQVACPKCQTLNAPSAKFCGNCGEVLSPVGPAAPANPA